MATRALFGPLLVAVGMTGCGHRSQTRYRVSLISDQTWPIGEAKPCSFDGMYMEMHCITPTQEALAAPKYDYLVDADFNKPVKFDAQHWAGGAYPYPDAFLTECWHCYECDASHRIVSLVSLLSKEYGL